MKRLSVMVLLASLRSGCYLSKQPVFEVDAGVEVPLQPGMYACSSSYAVPDMLVEHRVEHNQQHIYTFTMQDVPAREPDTMQVILRGERGFHPLGDGFYVTSSIPTLDGPPGDEPVYMNQIVRITENSIEYLGFQRKRHEQRHPAEAALVVLAGVRLEFGSAESTGMIHCMAALQHSGNFWCTSPNASRKWATQKRLLLFAACRSDAAAMDKHPVQRTGCFV